MNSKTSVNSNHQKARMKRKASCLKTNYLEHYPKTVQQAALEPAEANRSNKSQVSNMSTNRTRFPEIRN